MQRLRNEGNKLKQKQDISTKPYYRCFTCHMFRDTCGGRPTRDMDLREWCEYIRDIRDYFHLTNAYITEKAEASSKTTERIMAINTDQDIMRSTARRYEQAVIGPVGEFTCYLDHDTKTAEQQDAKITAVMAENEQLKAQLRQIDEIHRQDVRAIQAEYKEQISFLKDELIARRSKT